MSDIKTSKIVIGSIEEVQSYFESFLSENRNYDRTSNKTGHFLKTKDEFIADLVKIQDNFGGCGQIFYYVWTEHSDLNLEGLEEFNVSKCFVSEYVHIRKPISPEEMWKYGSGIK
jgi:hypothetical protein